MSPNSFAYLVFCFAVVAFTGIGCGADSVVVPGRQEPMDAHVPDGLDVVVIDSGRIPDSGPDGDPALDVIVDVDYETVTDIGSDIALDGDVEVADTTPDATPDTTSDVVGDVVADIREDAAASVDGGPEPDPHEDMILVPAGEFWMGCNEELDAFCRPNEHPYREVYVPDFLIDRTEVTQAAYERCVAAGTCSLTAEREACAWDPVLRSDYPVTCIDWYQARDYCLWAGKRLCSEAEWEKAARGNDGRIYPWGNTPPTCELMHNSSCGAEPLPVGSLPAGASPYGVEDMAGNAREWVEDDWHSNYDGAPDDGSAWIDSPRSIGRVRRGCCFGGLGGGLRTSARVGELAGHDCSCMGIRCCADFSMEKR